MLSVLDFLPPTLGRRFTFSALVSEGTEVPGPTDFRGAFALWGNLRGVAPEMELVGLLVWRSISAWGEQRGEVFTEQRLRLRNSHDSTRSHSRFNLLTEVLFHNMLDALGAAAPLARQYQDSMDYPHTTRRLKQTATNMIHDPWSMDSYPHNCFLHLKPTLLPHSEFHAVLFALLTAKRIF